MSRNSSLWTLSDHNMVDHNHFITKQINSQKNMLFVFFHSNNMIIISWFVRDGLDHYWTWKQCHHPAVCLIAKLQYLSSDRIFGQGIRHHCPTSVCWVVHSSFYNLQLYGLIHSHCSHPYCFQPCIEAMFSAKSSNKPTTCSAPNSRQT